MLSIHEICKKGHEQDDPCCQGKRQSKKPGQNKLKVCPAHNYYWKPI